VGRGPPAVSAGRRKAQIGPRLLARLDARADQDLQRLRLFERIDRVVADPHKFEAGLRTCTPGSRGRARSSPTP
jgi:hypothetical protein